MTKCANVGVMNGPLKFLTARKILPLLDLLAKFKRVLSCSCSPNFCVARKLAKQIFYFCSCSQRNRSARHARECSHRPFITPKCGAQISTVKVLCVTDFPKINLPLGNFHGYVNNNKRITNDSSRGKFYGLIRAQIGSTNHEKVK